MAYTSFFRDPDALGAIMKIALPVLSHRKEINVWDAGCATGEEPYTLAILFAANLRPFNFQNLDILATDHEESNFPQFEDRIKDALYSRKDIFWVPQEFRDVHFMPTDDPETFCLVQEIRNKVRYLRHDLLTYQAPENGKSLIVCKNVLMHFTPEEQLKVLAMFHSSLEANGFLALDGYQRMPAEFADLFIRVEPGTPLFQRKEA
jgi:chemotaxis protein methyltransferase CheR